MGDAAHTAHFSIGSGTKLALEDAIELARALQSRTRDLRAALAAYEAERSVEVLKIQNAARNSTEWFEHVERYTSFAARAVRVQPADAQPAHQPREPAPARRRLRRSASRAGSPSARRGGAGRPSAADVHAVHAARRDAGEPRSSSRRWRSTRASTACRTTTTSCTSAAARTAAPASCSPR